MAHNLAVINGETAMAYAGETPWHGLGKRLPKMANVQDALVAANLDWQVEAVPMFLASGEEVQGRRAMLRDDGTQLGTVGAGYVPRQNADAFGILDASCRDHGVRIEAAGALGKGERTWMLASMDATLEIETPGGIDRVNGYFLVANGHDGRCAHYGKITPIRVVCQNTLSAAGNAAEDNLVHIYHTKRSDEMLVQARKLVHTLTASLVETGETFGALARAEMTPNQIEAYIASVFPAGDDGKVSERLGKCREDIATLVRTGRGSELAGETAWGAYNAVVEYLDHVKPAEAKSKAGQVRAATSAVFGTGDQIKALALKLATRVAVAA